MAVNNNRSGDMAEPEAAIFNRTLLSDYSMQDQDLAAEILDLFLLQLPSMLAGLQTARSQAEWRFATHTLKGSAAVIGALRLQQLAAELEAMPFPGDDNVRLLKVQAAVAAASDLRRAARQAYPGRG